MLKILKISIGFFFYILIFLLKTLIVGTEAVLGSKIRKKGIPLYTPVIKYKSGVQVGIRFMDMFS